MEESAMISLELPVPVSENRYRRFVGKAPLISRAGRRYRETVRNLFLASGQRPVTGSAAVTMEFYPPDRLRRDLDNLFKSLFDALVYAGAVRDDSLIVEIHARKREVMKPAGMVHLLIREVR